MFATAQDVAIELGEDLTDEQIDLANTKISALEALIRLRLPDIAARTSASSDLMAVTRAVVAAAVARVLRNPDGKIQESVDDYSFRRSDVADGSLNLTADEWAMLSGSPAASSTAAFTITPGGSAPGRAWDAAW